MTLRMLCIDDATEKRNDNSIHRILTFADQARPALTQNLSFEPKEDDLTRIPPVGKAIDLEMEVVIRALRWNDFSKRFEIAMGAIPQVFGSKPGEGGAKPPVGK